MKTPAQSYDWSLIKRMYTSGQTAYAISKMEGMPTKQAVMYRAKKDGWDAVKAEAKELLPTVSEDQSRAGKAARILERLANGATHDLAAMSEGINRETWRTWRKADPLLQAKAEQAMALRLTKRIGNIDSAAERDWKAAAWLLERDPMTRDDLKPRETKGDNQGLTVVLNIDRTKVYIEKDGEQILVDASESRVVSEQ